MANQSTSLQLLVFVITTAIGFADPHNTRVPNVSRGPSGDACPGKDSDRPLLDVQHGDVPKQPYCLAWRNEPGWMSSKGLNAAAGFSKAFTGPIGKREFPNSGHAPIAAQWQICDLDLDGDIDHNDFAANQKKLAKNGSRKAVKASVWVVKKVPLFRREMLDPSSIKEVTLNGFVARLPYGWIWAYRSSNWNDSSFTYDKVYDTEVEARSALDDFMADLAVRMRDRYLTFNGYGR